MTAPKCPGLAAGAVSLRKSHDIVILSFCDIIKGQAIYQIHNTYEPYELLLIAKMRIYHFKPSTLAS